MADETIELTEVQAVLEGLSSPTDEQFVQAVRGYSDGAVASAAAKLALEGGGGGGGAGAPTWTGPYTVTFEDIDPVNFAAEIMTPGVGSWLLAGIVVVTDLFTVTTKLTLAAGPIDNLFLYEPDLLPDGLDPGVPGLTGGLQTPSYVGNAMGVVRFDDVTTNRVCLAVDDIPEAGSADIYVCFVTPVAP